MEVNLTLEIHFYFLFYLISTLEIHWLPSESSEVQRPQHLKMRWNSTQLQIPFLIMEHELHTNVE